MSPPDFEAINAELAQASAQELLRWGAQQFGDKLTLACSLGAEDVVLVDLVAQHAPETTIFTLDTGRLHQETYEVLDALRTRYSQLRFKIFLPEGQAVEELVAEQGIMGMRRTIDARRQCCDIRKLRPLRRALQDAEAWITGLRREQNVTRLDTLKVERDLMHGSIAKLNPLADWTQDQVWAWIRERGLPYNQLHDRGFPSIGCAPCTRAIADGEDERAGRWWWEQASSKECGLHAAKASPH